MLDASRFGVPQRRRRLFVVGHLGDDWRPPAAVLFERESLRRDLAKGEEEREDAAKPLGSHSTGGYRNDLDNDTFVAHTLRGEGFDASEDGTGRGTPLCAYAVTSRESKGADSSATSDNLVPVLADPVSANEANTYSHAGNNAGRLHNVVPFDETQITSRENRSNPQEGDPSPTLARGARPPTIAFSSKDHGADAGELSPTIRAGGHDASHANAGAPPAVAGARGVRRLTPRECERLMGMPDDHTLIPWPRRSSVAQEQAMEDLRALGAEPKAARRDMLAKDGPRYRAIGNSMAVPCIAWIGRRIALAHATLASTAVHAS